MKKRFFILSFLGVITWQLKSSLPKEYPWAVIGGGPAGIVAVAGLLDYGISPSEIIWLDRAFTVGRMGKYYQNIFSNTTVGDFLVSTQMLNVFSKAPLGPVLAYFKSRDQNDGCLLKYYSDFMGIASEYFRTQVTSEMIKVENIERVDNVWHLKKKDGFYLAKKVILAIGSKPKQFDYLPEKKILLYDALDKEKLKNLVQPDDVVAVFGNSHAAVLAIRILIDLGVKKIVNFYRSNIKYINSYYCYNASEGLAEELSHWVSEVLEKNPPSNLIQVFNSEKNRTIYRSEITKVIYALGFERDSIQIVGNEGEIKFDDRTGIIGHNLFGIGIAFPEGIIANGTYYRRVEIHHFINYIKRVLPVWVTL
jgi:thioredoxin reductase